jgi:hypothetical protein
MLIFLDRRVFLGSVSGFQLLIVKRLQDIIQIQSNEQTAYYDLFVIIPVLGDLFIAADPPIQLSICIIITLK